MIKIIIILILLATGFPQDKWELKFGNYYYSPIDSSKPEYLTQATIFIDSNQNKDFSFNTTDQSKVEDYLISMKSNKLYVEVIEDIVRRQESIPSIVLNVLTDEEKVELSNSFHVNEDLMYKLSNQLQSLISIDNTRGTNIYKVYIRSSYPSEAAFLINILIDTFIDSKKSFIINESKMIQGFLAQQIDRESQRLSEIELELKSFVEKNNVYKLDPNSEFLIHQLSVIESAYHQVEHELSVLIERKKYLLKHLSDKEIELSNKSSSRLDSRFYSLKQEIVSLETKYLDSKASNGEDYHGTKELMKRMKNIREVLENIVNKHVIQRDMITGGVEYRKALINNLIRIGLEIDINKNRLLAYKDLITNYEKNLSLMPHELINFQRLKREHAASTLMYTNLRVDIEEEKIYESSQMSFVRIIDEARSFPQSK